MRKTIFAALLLLPLMASAQSINYYPASSGGTTFTGGAITSALAAPAADNCAAIPYSFTSDTNTGLCTSAADTFNLYTAGASRLSGNSTALTSTVPIIAPLGLVSAPPYTFTGLTTTGMYAAAGPYLQFGVGGVRYVYMGGGAVAYEVPPVAAGITALGSTTSKWAALYISGYGTQGSLSKTLTDNTATAFVRLTVGDDDYEACGVGWTAYSEDAEGDARQIRKGKTNVAVLNNSGTEACNFSASTDDEAILVTAGTLTCTFDCTGGTNTVDLRATCDTSLDAAAETLTFEYRLDCESIIATVTPQ